MILKSKYLLEIIFKYINKKTFMEIIKYNKQLMSKLSITKYEYSKIFFSFNNNSNLFRKYIINSKIKIPKFNFISII